MNLFNFILRIRIALYGWDIFISHKKDESAKYARKLKDTLELKGFKCFLDEKEMPLGVRLSTEIDKGLYLSQSLLLIGTPYALESKFVVYELNNFNRDIMPINVSDTLNNCTNPKLQKNERIWINETTENIEEASPSQDVIESIELYFNKRKVQNQRLYAQLGVTAMFLIIGLTAFSYYLSNKNSIATADNERLQKEKIGKEKKVVEIEREFARREAKLKGDSLTLQAKLTLVETVRANQEDSLKKQKK